MTAHDSSDSESTSASASDETTDPASATTLRSRITEWLDEFGGHDAEISVYTTHGSFRDGASPTPETNETLAALRRQITAVPRQCYRNAVLAVKADDTLRYVEGVYTSDSIPIPVKHAWVEPVPDASTATPPPIFDVTIPDRLLADTSQRVYYGVSYDRERVLALTDDPDTDGVYPLASRHHNHATPHEPTDADTEPGSDQSHGKS